MSLNTNGWDYIYNLRFSKVNEILSTKKTESNTALDTLKTDLAKVLGDGTTDTNRIVVKSANFGEGYLNVPATHTLVSVDNGVPPNIVTKLMISKIEVDNSKITNDYTTAPTITISGGGGSGATATSSLGVLIIKVTNQGSNYFGIPNVTITGGSGSGAEASAIMSSSGTEVEFIKVTKLGTGYGSTNPPTVTIDGDATAVASFGGISIKINSSGSGYTSLPTITVTGGGGAGAIATAKFGVEIDSVTGGSGYKSPPLIEIPTTGTELGATAFTSLAFKDSSKLIGSKGTQTSTEYAKKSIKNCIDNGLTKITGFDSITSIDTSSEINVLDYCLAIVGNIVDKRHEKSIAEDLSLKFLFDYIDSNESFELGKSIITNYFPDLIPQREASESVTDTSYLKKFQKAAIDKLKTIEKEKIKNRVKAALQFVDNQIIYNINLSPTLSTSSKTLAQLGDELGNNKEGFLESMIGLLTALSPQTRMYDICGILHDNHQDSQQFPLKKIKLNTGPFTLETGGSDSLLRVNIPIITGLFYFGKDSKKYSQAEDNNANKFNIPLFLNLDWMRGAFKDTLPFSPPTNYVNLAVDNNQLATNISLALPGISARNKQIVMAFIDGYVQNFIKNPDPDIKFFDLVKQPYSYHDVFSQLNMGAYEALGLDEKGVTKDGFDKSKNNQKWLFPTRIAFGAKDEISLPADSKNSFLAICCMIKGNQNNGTSYVDLNAIPNEATSALVIERSVFGEHMVMPQIAKIFNLKVKNAENEKTIDFNIDYFDKKVTNSFRLYKESSAINKILVNQTLSLKDQDYKGTYGVFKDSEQKYNGKVEEINVRVEENLIRVTLPNVSYDIDTETSWLLTKQKVVAYQEYEIYFGASSTGKIEAKAQTKLFNLKMEHQKSLPSKILTLGGLQFFPTLYNLVKRYRSVETVNTSYIKKREIKKTQVAPKQDAKDMAKERITYMKSPRDQSDSFVSSSDVSEMIIINEDYGLRADIDSSLGVGFISPRAGVTKNEIPDLYNHENNDQWDGIELQKIKWETTVVKNNLSATLSKEHKDFDDQLKKDIRELKVEKDKLVRKPLDIKLLKEFFDEFQKFRQAINIADINKTKNKKLFLAYYDYKQNDGQERSLAELIKIMKEAELTNLWFDEISKINDSVKKMHRYFKEHPNIKKYEKAVYCYEMYIEFLTN